MTQEAARIPQHNQLKDQAYAYVKNRVLDLTFPPGQPLREAALVQECGISKTPIREALIRLEQEGFVTVMPYRGAFVSDYSKNDLEEIAELRELLEGAAVRKAAESMAPEDLEEFRRITEAAQEAYEGGDTEAVVDLFDAFDDLLFAQVGNRRIAKLLSELRDHMVRIGRLTAGIPGRIGRSLEQHQMIYDAVRKGDSEDAERLMREHVRSVMADQLQVVTQAS